LGKKILIVLLAAFGCVFLVELTLHVSNPFIQVENNDNTPEMTPQIMVERSPHLNKTSQIIFISGINQTNKDLNHHWIHHYTENWENKQKITIYNVSSHRHFIREPALITTVLKKDKPQMFIFMPDPHLLADILPIPDFEFWEDKRPKIFTGETEIRRTIQAILEYQKIDTTSVFDYQHPMGLSEKPDSTPPHLYQLLHTEAQKLSKGILKIARFCQKEGIEFLIIPYPILWNHINHDRYLHIPLDRIIIQNHNASLWYSNLYHELLHKMNGYTKKEIRWINTYKIFPSDSRFYTNGFQLSMEGHQMFAEMLYGRKEKLPAIIRPQ